MAYRKIDRRYSENIFKHKHEHPICFPFLSDEKRHVRFLKRRKYKPFKIGAISKGDDRKYKFYEDKTNK